MFEDRDAKHHSGKYYGPYRAIVKDNRDPKKLNRIKVACPSIYGEDADGQLIVSDWIYPSTAMAGKNFGASIVPPMMDKFGGDVLVWIMFEMGDANYPIYIGSPYGLTNGVSDVPVESRKRPDGSDRQIPNNFVFKTTQGHVVEMDDDVLSQGVRLTTKNGMSVILDDVKDSISIGNKDDAMTLTINKSVGTFLDFYVNVEHPFGIRLKLMSGTIHDGAIELELYSGVESKTLGFVSR